MKDYYVYMLASGKHGTLYIGVTNDISALPMILPAEFMNTKPARHRASLKNTTLSHWSGMRFIKASKSLFSAKKRRSVGIASGKSI
jgi:hypothetical protein